MEAIPRFVVIVSSKAKGCSNIEELRENVVSVQNGVKPFLGDEQSA
jgi:hypothetical protein